MSSFFEEATYLKVSQGSFFFLYIIDNEWDMIFSGIVLAIDVSVVTLQKKDMKGFEEYTKEHGNHFTEELAYKVLDCKWNAEQIEKVAQDKVYYNVTESSLGDMVFLANLMSKISSLNRSVDYALSVIGNVYCAEKPFLIWVNNIAEKEDFDFTPYI